jgi:transcriptional antiterminator RfaH
MHMYLWTVAYTQARQEFFAGEQLLQQGYAVYIPKFKKLRRHARKKDWVITSLFPRYIFVGLPTADTTWRAVNGTKGIVHLLVNAEHQPLAVPQATLSALQAAEIEGLVPISCLHGLKIGDPVLIAEGSFKDYTAVYEGMDDENRVQILLNFLGREHHVVLNSDAVEHCN